MKRIAIPLMLLLLASCSSPTTSSSGSSNASSSSGSSNNPSSSVTSSGSNSTISSSEDTSSIQSGSIDITATLVQVTLGEQISIKNANRYISSSGSTVSITGEGDYAFTGSLTNGQIQVKAAKTDKVKIYLNGVSITNTKNAPIYIASSDRTTIELVEGSVNYLEDAMSYTYEDTTNLEPNACLFSKDDLVLTGEGRLIVKGNFNNGIGTKNDLKITGGNYDVFAINNALKGNDSIAIENADFVLTSSGDAIKTDNIIDAGKGTCLITSGTFNINAVNDGFDIATDLTINAGEFNIITGATTSAIGDTLSHKGIKAATNLVINGGNIVIDSLDDAIHGNSNVTINGGNIEIKTKDDAIHAQTKLEINNGTIDIKASYEGLESESIYIKGNSVINLVSTDDGINGAGGDGSSGDFRPSTSGNGIIEISGGRTFINSGSDGIDVNGSITMTGGLVIIQGPTDNGNSALDYDRNFNISGGTLVALGSSQMAQNVSSTSTQTTVMVNFAQAQNAETLLAIKSQDQEVVTVKPLKQYQSIIVSSSSLVQGATLDVYTGGTHSGTLNGIIYEGGEYTSSSSALYSFTLSQRVYTYSQGGGGGGWRP